VLLISALSEGNLKHCRKKDLRPSEASRSRIGDTNNVYLRKGEDDEKYCGHLEAKISVSESVITIEIAYLWILDDIKIAGERQIACHLPPLIFQGRGSEGRVLQSLNHGREPFRETFVCIGKGFIV
jgi:hypothetical protein